MYRNKTIAVVVPAYNEEFLIENTLKTIPRFVDKIIVVDDASTDRTAYKINQADFVLIHSENRGVGAAIATGYQRAKELNMDITVVMAADGQMDPRDFENIISPVVGGHADYAKGNRFIIPLWKYFGNVVLSFFTRLITGYKISDCQSGYTAISLDILTRLDLSSIYPRYGMPNDMLFKLSKLGAKVKDVYTQPIYHIGETTGIRLKQVIPKISWLFLRAAWLRLSH